MSCCRIPIKNRLSLKAARDSILQHVPTSSVGELVATVGFIRLEGAGGITMVP